MRFRITDLPFAAIAGPKLQRVPPIQLGAPQEEDAKPEATLNAWRHATKLVVTVTMNSGGEDNCGIAVGATSADVLASAARRVWCSARCRDLSH